MRSKQGMTELDVSSCERAEGEDLLDAVSKDICHLRSPSLEAISYCGRRKKKKKAEKEEEGREFC